MQDVPIATHHGVRLKERVERRLLGCVGDRLEQPIERRALRPELALDEDVDVVSGPRSRARNSIGGRERDEDLAAAVVAHRPSPRQPDVDAPREPLELSRVKRRVGGDDGDA